MRIGVTGATGFIGGWVARTASARGHDVVAFARDASRLDPDVAGRAVVSAAPLTDAHVLARALAGIDVLVHAAAIYAYERSGGERMVTENPALARTVLAAARAAGVDHVVDVSSAIVFRPHDEGARAGMADTDSPLWDASDPHWGDPYLRSKVLAEHEARRARDEGQRISSIHPTLTIGPRDRGPGQSGSTLLLILRGRLLPDARVGWVDVRDVADAVLAAASRPPGGRYLLNARSPTFRSVARALDHLTGHRRHRWFLPRPLVRLAARANEAAGGRMADVPAPAALEFLLAGGRSDGWTGGELLGGYRRLEETFSDALRWWADNGVVEPAELGRIGRMTAPPSPGS
jgi:dihydroflavonol-4-reductase